MDAKFENKILILLYLDRDFEFVFLHISNWLMMIL